MKEAIELREPTSLYAAQPLEVKLMYGSKRVKKI